MFVNTCSSSEAWPCLASAYVLICSIILPIFSIDSLSHSVLSPYCPPPLPCVLSHQWIAANVHQLSCSPLPWAFRVLRASGHTHLHVPSSLPTPAALHVLGCFWANNTVISYGQLCTISAPLALLLECVFKEISSLNQHFFFFSMKAYPV